MVTRLYLYDLGAYLQRLSIVVYCNSYFIIQYRDCNNRWRQVHSDTSFLRRRKNKFTAEIVSRRNQCKKSTFVVMFSFCLQSMDLCVYLCVCVCVCDHGLLIYLNNKTIKLKSRDKRNFYEFHACILNAWRSLIYAAIVISKFQKLRGLFCGTNICVLIGWPRMENKSFRLTGDGTLLY